MAISESRTDIGGREAPRLTGLRDAVGLFVILASISFNVLLVLAIQPVMSTIGAFYGGGTHGALISQLLETMSGVGIMLGAPISGWIAGRIGTKRLLLLALTVYGVSGSACALTDTVPILLTLRLLQGFGSSAIAVSTYSLVSERFEGAARSRMIGYQGVFISAMGFISLPLAGMIADGRGWHAPFALYLSAFVMLLLAWLTVPANRPVASQWAEADGTIGGWWVPLLPLYLLAIPLYLIANLTNLNISFLLAGDGITKSAGQSYIMLASSVLYLVGGLLYGHIVVRLGTRRMLVLILALMAGNGLIVGASHDPYVMALGVGLSGLSGGLMIPFMTNLVVNRASPEARSRALGFFYMASYIGNFLNPPIMTPIRAAIGNHETFLAVGMLMAVLAAVQGISRRSAV